MVQNHKRQEALKQKKEIEKNKLSQITSTKELLQYRIGGIFCGDKFSRIDVQKIFARKKFCNFTIVIMIEGRGRYRLRRKLVGVVQICVHLLSCLLCSSAYLLCSLLTLLFVAAMYTKIYGLQRSLLAKKNQAISMTFTLLRKKTR